MRVSMTSSRIRERGSPGSHLLGQALRPGSCCVLLRAPRIDDDYLRTTWACPVIHSEFFCVYAVRFNDAAVLTTKTLEHQGRVRAAGCGVHLLSPTCRPALITCLRGSRRRYGIRRNTEHRSCIATKVTIKPSKAARELSEWRQCASPDFATSFLPPPNLSITHPALSKHATDAYILQQ